MVKIAVVLQWLEACFFPNNHTNMLFVKLFLQSNIEICFLHILNALIYLKYKLKPGKLEYCRLIQWCTHLNILLE